MSPPADRPPHRGAVLLRVLAIATIGVLALLPVPSVAEPERPSRLDDGGLSVPPATRTALERLADAANRGNSGDLMELLAPRSRAGSADLVRRVVGSAERPISDHRVAVLGIFVTDGTVRGHALLTAVTATPPRVSSAAGWEVPDARRAALGIEFEHDAAAGGGGLVIRMGQGAAVRHASTELRVDPAALTIEAATTLTLAASSGGQRLVELTVPGRSAFRVTSGATVQAAYRPWGEDHPASVLLALPDRVAEGETFVLGVEHRETLGDDAFPGGCLFVATQYSLLPWAGSGRFTFDAVFDVPAQLRPVSLGPARELPAPAGRRRVRHSVERSVDLLVMAVGPYSVDRITVGDASLELWRTREVGGAAEPLLKQLRELVDFHEERVGSLPYRAFRLVELPNPKAFPGVLAMSYASLIVMTPGLMATEQRRYEILSHEVAHQWWGNWISGDQDTRWVSEGLADACEDRIVRIHRGDERYRAALERHRRMILGQLGIGTPRLAHGPAGMLDYSRGALAMHSLANVVGDDGFWKILRAWQERFADRRVGTDALQRVAEETAGRSLAGVFDPWMRSTALPVLSLEWATEQLEDGAVVRGVIRQEAPAFDLVVPVVLHSSDGVETVTELAISGEETAFEVPAPTPPLDVELDPHGVSPRVRDDELEIYRLREARAAASRGDHARAVRLFRARSLDELATVDLLLLSAAVSLGGGETDLGDAVATRLAGLEPTDRQHVLLQQVDHLLASESPTLALPLIEQLSAEVDDGAAVPLRLGRALRQLGREREATAAFERALSRRPFNVGAAVALGRTAAKPPRAAESPALFGDGVHSSFGEEITRALALGDGRVAVLQARARRLLLGGTDGFAAVPDFEPIGSDAAVIRRDGRLFVAVLEGGLNRSRVSIIGADGPGQVVATHERCPGRATLLATNGSDLALGFEARSGETSWWRFENDPLVSTEGPDDRDGLKRLRPKGDPRLSELGVCGSKMAIVLSRSGLAWSEGDRVVTSESVAWEDPALRDTAVVSLDSCDEAAVLVVSGNRARSPFTEDALPESRLVVIEEDGAQREREVPADVVSASLAPDGDLALLRGSPPRLHLLAFQ